MKNKIVDILNKSKIARDFYRRNVNLEDSNLLKNLKAIIDIEDRIKEDPILKDVLSDYINLFNFSPIEIANSIKFKDSVEIRKKYEEEKRKFNLSGGKINFLEEDNSFKSSFEKNESLGNNNFSGHGRDLNL